MRDDDVLIKVEGVSKKFCRSLKRSMVYEMRGVARDALGLPVQSADLCLEAFWKVEDVSFGVRRGNVWALLALTGQVKVPCS